MYDEDHLSTILQGFTIEARGKIESPFITYSTI